MLDVSIWTEIKLLCADPPGSKCKTNRTQGGSNTAVQIDTGRNYIVRADGVQTSWVIYCWAQSSLEEVSCISTKIWFHYVYRGCFLPVNAIQSRAMWMQGTSNTRYKEGPRASVCSLRAFCAEQREEAQVCSQVSALQNVQPILCVCHLPILMFWCISAVILRHVNLAWLKGALCSVKTWAFITAKHTMRYFP